MNLNILTPRSAVKDSLENPNMALALVLVLIPSIVSVVWGVVSGLSLNVVAVGYSVVANYLRFFIIAAIFFLLVYILKGKEISGKFNGIFSALSLLWVFVLVFTVLGMFLPGMLSPEIQGIVKDAQNGKISADDAAERLAVEVEKEGAINYSGIFVISALLLIVLVYSLIFYYILVSEMFQFGFIKNLIMWIILLLVLMFIPL